MLTLNPRTGALVDTDRCVSLEPVAHGLVPVCVESSWFVHDPYTNTLWSVEDVWESLLPSDRVALRGRIKAQDLIERTERRIAWIEVTNEPLTGGVNTLSERFGSVAYHAARTYLRHRYDARLVEHAFATLDTLPSFGDVEPLIFDPDGIYDVVEGVEDKHALKAVFLAGAGGSGKSSIGAFAFAGEGFKFLNQDKHLERFLKDANVPLSQAGSRYDLFNKARDLKAKEQALYSGQRLGLVIDSTGWDYKRIADPAAALEHLGYDTYMIFVTTSLETALARNAQRGQRGGRSVPDSFIRDAWDGAHDNIGRFRRLFGRRFFLVDNDEDLNPAQFDRRIAPVVKKIANKILAAPISNPTGRKWLESGGTYEPPAIVPPATPKPASPAKPKGSQPPRASLPKAAAPSAPVVTRDALKDALARANARLKTKKSQTSEVILPHGTSV